MYPRHHYLINKGIYVAIVRIEITYLSSTKFELIYKRKVLFTAECYESLNFLSQLL